MKFKLTFVTLLLSTALYCQNTFFIGNKTYESSDSFELLSNENIGGQNLTITIAKTTSGGLLVLSTKLYFEDLRISGKILIYLDNKTVITCLDRGKNDYVNNTSTSVFNLTNEEINKLENSNIYSIRFTIKSTNKNSYGSPIGNHSVRNYIDESNIINRERIDFPSIVSNLFE